jgi:hypothetical protein
MMLTVDSNTGGNRERDLRTGFSIPFRLTLGGMMQFALKPMWGINYLTHERFKLPQLDEHVETSGGAMSIGRYFTEMLDPSMNWSDVAEMVRLWNGHFCLKGIMSVVDAKRAIEIGCTGGFAEPLETVTRERQRRRDEVRAALQGSPWTKLQLYLTLWPRTLAEITRLEKPIARHARKVLRKTWKKAAKLGRNLGKLDVEHRHEMRKALKKLRYQTEFFAPLFGKRDTERFIDQLKSLQDVFGYINDVRMAPKLVELQKQSSRHGCGAGGQLRRGAS